MRPRIIQRVKKKDLSKKIIELKSFRLLELSLAKQIYCRQGKNALRLRIKKYNPTIPEDTRKFLNGIFYLSQ